MSASPTNSRTAMDSMIAGARPCRPGEYVYLCDQLPELATFLQERGFA